MMKLYLLGAMFFVALTLFAQNRERVVSGQLKSNEDGTPLPGVNIVIKGTDVGTVTDADGRYSISVPIGSVLVFSFIGMQTREILVTETSLQGVSGKTPVRIRSQKGNWNPSILADTIKTDTEGVTTLRHNTPSYRMWAQRFNPGDIVSIRRPLWTRLSRNTKTYVVETNSDSYLPAAFGLQLMGTVGFNTHTQLPKLQSQFAQGPDEHPEMNWGPQILGGTNTYNPYKFFRTGVNTNYDVSAWFPGISMSSTSLNVSRKKNQGVVPNNDFTIDNASLNMKKINITHRIKADVNLLYNLSNGNLMTRGANISNIIGSMMLTAPTFDASNGYSRHAAIVNPSVYQLPDGTARSAAPGMIDNPYGLAATLPDYEKARRLMSSLGLTYRNNADNLNLILNASAERQQGNIVYGVQPGYSPYLPGRRTDRNETRQDVALNLSGTYDIKNTYENHTTLSFGYMFRQERREVSRRDNLADSLSAFDFSLTRNIHEVFAKIQYEFNNSNIQFVNRSYFSNTAKNYVNLFPTLGAKWDLKRTWYLDFFDQLQPFLNISRSLREAPAIFGNQAVLSTQLNSQNFNRYFENREITWNNQISPETELKSEIGVRASTWAFGNLSLDFSYYNNFTSNLIIPVWNEGTPVLSNAATVNNKGINLTLRYYPYNYYKKFTWGVDLRWTKYNSVVTAADLPGDYLPLAGFSNIQTVIAKDQPLGAIYGTTWKRDDNGNKIIDSDGFPIADPKLQKIGNPIPKYIISLEPFSTWKGFRFSFIIDFKKGGQVWNGTKAALNYSGRSQETADQRNTSRYIFDGVTTFGAVNTKQVDFYDPTLPLQQNRWVRYGFSGVGEEHIEDASWIRLNEVNFSYKCYPFFGNTRKECVFAFIARNLFVITPYSGVDPGAALFGYSNGTGLDLFNSPSLKTYNFSVTIKL